MSNSNASSHEPLQWKISTGNRQGGPFSRERLRSLVDAGRVGPATFVRDTSELGDWAEVQTIDWLMEEPERAVTRWCPECDARILVISEDKKRPRRCPQCRAPVVFVDYLQSSDDIDLHPVPEDPLGKYQYLAIAAATIALAGGCFAIISLIWNPVLSVLIAFIFLVAGGALFSLTFRDIGYLSRFRLRQQKLEQLLDVRTNSLLSTSTQLRGLNRGLAEIRNRLESDIQREFEDQRRLLSQQMKTAADSVNSVHRMAERFLDETQKWWTSKLNSDNYPATKERLRKAIEFCRRNGYSVPSKLERDIMKKLQQDYELVLRREAEREQQLKIREQIREEAKVTRELKREMERVERERKMIEAAIEAAMRKAGAEHSAEIEALRARLAEAEERGRRTQAQAELTKAGHVYVISNVGAFGEHVYKVGMTRRLVPADRVRELSDASVPFPFDVHMMIASENAPTLENTLHRALHPYRVNRVNFRKEFFRVDLDSIRKIVEANHGVVEFQVEAEASEYRQTLSISQSDYEYLSMANAAADIDDPLEDEVLDGDEQESERF
jgi:hypothetical protein